MYPWQTADAGNAVHDVGSADVIERLTADELLDATAGDPLVRAVVLGGRIVGPAWSGYGAYAWSGTHRGAPAAMGIGSPSGAAQLLSAIDGELSDLRYASLPRGWLNHVVDERVTYKADWDWFWTEKASHDTLVSHDAAWLDDDDSHDVRALLENAMPGAAAQPGDARVRRWAGIRNGTGRLVACAADTFLSPMIGHLSSVATATDQRRMGYGGAIVDWMVRQYLDEGAQMVTLGMYADNITARKLYDRLGFHCQHLFTSVEIAAESGGTTPSDA